MEQMKELHRRCFDNARHIRPETKCGCFHCGAVYAGAAIQDWIRAAREEHRENTARCPYCGVDSVLYEDDEVQITDTLLDAMGQYWFGEEAENGRKIYRMYKEGMKEE